MPALLLCAKFSWGDPFADHLRRAGSTAWHNNAIAAPFFMWPIHCYFRLPITSPTGGRPVCRQSSLFETILGQCTPMARRRQVLIDAWCFRVTVRVLPSVKKKRIIFDSRFITTVNIQKLWALVTFYNPINRNVCYFRRHSTFLS